MTILSSATHFLELLSSPSTSTQSLCLSKLLCLLPSHWPQISNSLPFLESLFEQDNFQHKQQCALLISQLYYHLEEYEESIEYALEAGELFEVGKRNMYEECIVVKAIERYIQLKQAQSSGQQAQLNQKIDEFFERIFKKSIEQKNYKNALGICLEARRLDKIQQIIKISDNVDLINYLYELTIKHTINRQFRFQVLEFISSIYKMKKLEPQDYINFCQCSYHLNEHQQVASVLSELISSDKQNFILLAFQIGQDLHENENKWFQEKVIESLGDMGISEGVKGKLVRIINGGFSQEQYIKFLIQNNKADYQTILQIKEKIDQKQSVSHSSVIFANSLQYAGTTDDKFIRDNLEWVSKATHWAKFNLVSSMGVIHQNNVTQAMTLLKPYLPGQTPTPNYYANGGSLMALGLIYQKTKDQNNQNEIIIHGSCMGLGLISLGSEDPLIYEELKNVLFTNQATTSEAAGLAIGLLMAGSGNIAVFDQLMNYAEETQHEKIIRALSLAGASIFFQKEEAADKSIEFMLKSQDAIVRQGGVQSIGMAYCGTSNTKATKLLLSFISSDVSDDVKRSAVISLGFLFINNHSALPQILNMLVISYNAHVRYGTALALGISGAGKGNQETLKMLEPMLNDTSDFVRQGAMISMALVLQQMTEQMEPQVAVFRKEIQEVYSKKQEGVLCKLGAIISQGILNSGGRNSTLQLSSKSGSLKMGACIGTLYFTHYWYWFSSIHFLSLALSPSALIGVDKDLEVPSGFQFQSNSKASLFGYPKMVDRSKEEEVKREQKVQLSTTMKVNKRQISRKPQEVVVETTIEKKEEPMIIEEEPLTTVLSNPSRVLERQQNYISFIQNRYKPILKNRTKGIVFLIDTQPEQKKEQENVQESGKMEEEFVQPPDDFIFEEQDENQKLI